MSVAAMFCASFYKKIIGNLLLTIKVKSVTNFHNCEKSKLCNIHGLKCIHVGLQQTLIKVLVFCRNDSDSVSQQAHCP